MMLLALPLIALYFMAGGIALLVDKRRDSRAAKVEIDTTIQAPTPITE